MAVEAHYPRGLSRHPVPAKRAAARGLAMWVVPEEGTSPELLARAAQLVLARALQTAPEAEVHWPAAGAPTSGVSAPAEGAADHSSRTPSAAENPGAREEAPEEAPEGAPDVAPAALSSEDDGGTRLPPSAGPVSRVAVDLAADQVLLDGTPVALTGVEFKVLRYLVTHLSRPVDREELQEFLDSFETPGASARSIDVYVGRIRRKLGNARHAVATVRGGGYRFMPGACATVRGPAEYCI
ncbi:two-component system OmpR family response regulator [Pseudarthrobacter siccitolerans]|uniref:Two-component system OmpR family response regulator n=1 Tax=Pseudarthrobacter siccitolerans TaxID=861266 RepID=A0ABU0PKK6_9MICC|nr:winged helix-turn-helix domain-containing protein [Pseudarthrobacter siccitolerans]MDQ0674505.1 two-component system OmpR family response regulator [Pseudarthrobacter siccitolerans]